VTGESPDFYEIGIDQSARHSGTTSAFVRAPNASPGGFASISQTIRVDAYRAKRVRLSAYVRAERVTDHAGLWMRVDGASYSLQFDNMTDRSIKGTSDWNEYEVVLDVPEESLSITFGILLKGGGQVWADDFKLEVVGLDVPSTGKLGFRERKQGEFTRLSEEERRYAEQITMTRAYNLRATPTNMGFESLN
jgi:hypothetical protein